MIALKKFMFQRQLWLLANRATIHTTITQNSSIEQLIAKVDQDVRKNGRITKKDMDTMFRIITKYGFKQPSHSLILLRCCGSLLCEVKPEIRNNVTDDVWAALKASNIPLNVSHYNALLNSYLENKKEFNPCDIVAEMDSLSIEPNRVTYQRLLHRYCQIGDIQGAFKLLEHMKSKSLPLNEAIFNSLILGYSRTGDLDAAFGVIKQMESANIDLSNNTFRVLLCSMGEHLKEGSEVEPKLNDVLNLLSTKEVTMTDRDWLDVVLAIAKADETSPLIDTFLKKCKQHVGYNQDCYNTILELANERKIDTALKILESMKSPEETQNSGTFFVIHLMKSGVDKESVMRTCDILYNKGINKYCYRKAAEIAFEEHDLNTCKYYLNQFLTKTNEECKPHYVWPLFAKCQTDEETLVILKDYLSPLIYATNFTTLAETFRMYVWPKVKMDTDIFIERCKEFGFTYLVLIASLLKMKLDERNLIDAAKIFVDEKYFQKNIFDRYLIPSFCSIFCETGDVESMVSILKKASTATTIVSDKVGQFLQTLIKQDDLDKSLLSALLNALHENDVFITSASEKEIIEKNILNKDEKKLLSSLVADISKEDRVAYNKALTIEELEEQYTDLTRRGIVARGTIRHLLANYCRTPVDTSTEHGKEELKTIRSRVEQLLKEFADETGSFTVSLRALLLQFYATKCEDLDEALKYKQMDSCTFDAAKIIHLAKLMVIKGKVNEAIQLLTEEAKIDRPDSTTYLRDQFVVDMLNIAAETTKDANVVKSLLDAALAVTKNKRSNFLMSTVVKTHLLNNDIAKAVAEFEYCVNNYKMTPSHIELLVWCIKADDSKTLQQITDLTNSVHGDHNTLFDLAVALIQCDKIKQAKKVMSTPGLRISERRLKKFVEYCMKHGRIDMLEQLIPLLKLGFDANLDDVYFQMFQMYEKEGNTNKCLELWTQIQEDNTFLSDKTLNFLSNLKDNKKDIPFALKN